MFIALKHFVYKISWNAACRSSANGLYKKARDEARDGNILVAGTFRQAAQTVERNQLK